MIDHVSLEIVDTIAAKSAVTPRKKYRSFGVFAVSAQEERAGAFEAQGGLRAFDPHFAHGPPAVVRSVIGEAVSVENTLRALGEIKQHKTRVFARYHRIELFQVGINRRNLAEEVAEGIDEMDRGFVDQKLLHALEIRLAIEIGARTLTIARPQPEQHLIQIPKSAVVNQRLGGSVPGLKAEIFVHDYRCRASGDPRFGLAGLGEVAAERLLADGRNSARGHKADVGQMGFGRGDDVDDVRPFRFEHRLEIGVGPRTAELRGDRLRPLARAVADADQAHLGDARPGFVMEPAEISGADCRKFQCARHVTHPAATREDCAGRLR